MSRTSGTCAQGWSLVTDAHGPPVPVTPHTDHTAVFFRHMLVDRLSKGEEVWGLGGPPKYGPQLPHPCYRTLPAALFWEQSGMVTTWSPTYTTRNTTSRTPCAALCPSHLHPVTANSLYSALGPSILLLNPKTFHSWSHETRPHSQPGMSSCPPCPFLSATVLVSPLKALDVVVPLSAQGPLAGEIDL